MAGAGVPPRSSSFASDRFSDGRLFNPTCLRNNAPMVARLALFFDGHSGPVLEIGAGSGQHAAAFGAAFPHLDWIPSDPDPVHRMSITAWQREMRAPERMPLDLDATEGWANRSDIRALGPLAGVLSMNVIHIAPIAVLDGILRGAAKALGEDGLLIFYGPFMVGGEHTGPGNQRFDESLRSQDPAWGIRDLREVAEKAAELGFGKPEVQGMPADNRLVVFRQSVRRERV